MNRYDTIPTEDGLYWYFENNKAPDPVLINQKRYGDRMKSFNGKEQSWLREGEYLIGPVMPPQPESGAKNGGQ